MMPASQVSKYLCEAEDRSLSTAHLSDPLRFWADRENIHDKLSLVAEDIISAPASQAYVETVFSVCGMLTTGRRNRMTKSLEMRACLKLIAKYWPPPVSICLSEQYCLNWS